MRVTRHVAAVALAAAMTISLAPVTVPPASAEAIDVISPSGHAVALRNAPRKLSVTYVHRGRRHTLDDFLARTKTSGFVVLDGQDVVAERSTGASRTTRFQSWSVAKSFTSAAVDIALGEGRIRSLDDPVDKYLPELARSGYAGVSIRDLLRMSSGIEWDEATDVPRPHAAADRGRPLRRTAARQVRGWKPGSRFEYTSLTSSPS
ncbi:serine hydrolase [Planomonospora sphaerica]|uniref:Serine hydrolase n=1 Tax=Planomonospora sphaerica TaxID=161355 RepID=A0A171DP93_9ACTN|nr:serine hydrolase domain-containing protein [Planomonospora sphaerica]GAT70876.1 serine hydrolase [Planomonospora sphaerica]